MRCPAEGSDGWSGDFPSFDCLWLVCSPVLCSSHAFCLRRSAPCSQVYLKFSRKAIPEGAFAGVFHVTIVRLDNFSDTAGLMDRTDPFVELRLGNECLKTSVKNNAGGHNVVYDETLSFNKRLLAGELKIKVMD